MTLFDRLERRFGWLAFPGFLRYYALFHILVFVLQLFSPDIGPVLAFDRAKIFSGEVWRVVTMFFANPQFGRPSLLNIALLIFAVNFVFMVSDGLENAWGAFKTSLFYYTGILLVLLANFIYPFAIPASGVALFGAAFIAFATLFPKTEILLFFIIPIQVRFLGMFAAALIVLSAISQPILLPFYLLAYTNYFIWAGIPALRGTARMIESGKTEKSVQLRKSLDVRGLPHLRRLQENRDFRSAVGVPHRHGRRGILHRAPAGVTRSWRRFPITAPEFRDPNQSRIFSAKLPTIRVAKTSEQFPNILTPDGSNASSPVKRTAVRTPRTVPSSMNGTAIMARVALPKAMSMAGECRSCFSILVT